MTDLFPVASLQIDSTGVRMVISGIIMIKIKINCSAGPSVHILSSMLNDSFTV